MKTLLAPLRPLLDPTAAVAPAVSARKWFLPLLLVCAAVGASGASVATRLDAARLVIPQMEASGDLAKASEREIDEKVAQSQRIGIVAGIAKGVFVTPLMVLLLSLALKLFAWITARKLALASAFTVCALAMLPVACFHLLVAVSALRQDSLSPAMAATLVPSTLAVFVPKAEPPLRRALEAVDVFNLWAACLLGLGYAAATNLSKWRGLLAGVGLYVLFAAAFLVGLPGLMASLGGGLP